MPPGRGTLEGYHAPTDLTSTLVSNGAGSWGYGQLYIDLSAASGTSIEVIGIHPHIDRRDLAAPAWVYIPTAGCGPNAGDRVFKFDLDKPLLTDEGLEEAPGNQHPTDAPSAALGPGFTLTGAEHARIRIDAQSCHGNYEWSVTVQYATAGAAGIQTETLGPFQSYGVADNTAQYEGAQDATGTVQVSSKQTITGDDRTFGCQ